MSIIFPLLLILLMVAVNALYVAAEFATVGSRRSRVQEAAEAGSASAAGLLTILKDPKKLDNYVAACQIGITLSSLVAGAFGQSRLTPILTPYFGEGGQVVAVIIVLVLITALQVVLGELLPKTVALRYPEQLALACLVPMRFSQWLFTPLISLFNGTAFALMRAFKLNTEHSHAHVHSPEELEGLYRESAAGGLIDAEERDMLAGILNVEGRVVREIMTPRTALLTVPADLHAEEALRKLAGSPYSRFPVIHGDDIVGVVHLRRLYLVAQKTPLVPVWDVMLTPLVVAEVMNVPDLWRKLRAEGRHSALVVNEYGTVVGMVTLEDALEEIFGELQDEFDQEDAPITVQGQWVSVRGDVLLETLNARFDLKLPEDEVDTVSGLAWMELSRLPMVGDEFAVEPSGLLMRVEAVERRAVKRVGFNMPEGRA